MQLAPHTIIERYYTEGFQPISYKPRTKNPTARGWQLQRPTAQQMIADAINGQNIGLLLGEAHGSLADIDLDSQESLSIADMYLPRTEWEFGHVSKPRSHRLYRVINPETAKYIKIQDPQPLNGSGVHVELRYGTGLQTTVPPSVHVSGEQISWTSFGMLTEVDGSILTHAVNFIGAASILAHHWQDGIRQDAAMALAGGLLRSGWHETDVMVFINQLASCAGDAEIDSRYRAIVATTKKLADGENVYGWPHLAQLLGDDVVKKVKQLIGVKDVSNNSNNEPDKASLKGLTKIPTIAGYLLTEGGNADVFVKLYRDRVRHVLGKGDGTWFVYDGIAWRKDITRQVGHLARSAIRSIGDAATNDDVQEDDKKKLIAHFIRSDNAQGVHNVLKLARDKPGITVSREIFDLNPWTLNTPTGTLDLKTGTLNQHDRNDYLSKVTLAEYDETSECPIWLRFIERATNNDPEKIRYIQKAIGYTLSGSTQEKCMFFLIGPTNTGKSIFTEMIAYVLGDYAQHTNVETFLSQGRSNGNSNDVAALVGARYVYTSEPGEGKKLKEELVKALTGGDRQSARFLFEEFFQFTAQFKAWVGTNHFPRVQGVDESIWGRLKPIPFKVQIPKDEQIPRDQFLDTLKSEQTGILKWCLRGLSLYLSEGLSDPDFIKAAINEHRSDNDAIGMWIEENVAFPVDSTNRKEKLAYTCTLVAAMQSFQGWCAMNSTNAKNLTRSAFKEYLLERYDVEVFIDPQNKGINFIGLSLIESSY